MMPTSLDPCPGPPFAAARRRAFTLIELVIVLAMIGILAAISITKISGASEEAQIATMIADLRLAVLHEESHAALHGGNYFSGTATEQNAVKGFKTSPGVTVTLKAPANRAGSRPAWTAVARRVGSDKRCGVKRGVISCVTSGGWTVGEVRN